MPLKDANSLSIWLTLESGETAKIYKDLYKDCTGIDDWGSYSNSYWHVLQSYCILSDDVLVGYMGSDEYYVGIVEADKTGGDMEYCQD